MTTAPFSDEPHSRSANYVKTIHDADVLSTGHVVAAGVAADDRAAQGSDGTRPDAGNLLGGYDVATALARLIGPVVFIRLAGLGRTNRADCVRIVDDFFAARAATATRPAPDSRAGACESLG